MSPCDHSLLCLQYSSLLYISLIAVDISSRLERKAAETRLREEQDAMLKMAVEATPSGMVMVRSDGQGTIVLVNATAEKVGLSVYEAYIKRL